MPIDKHTMQVVDGSSAIFTDRTIVGMQVGIANLAGGGAGTAVTTAVTFAEGLPATYSVFASASQSAVVGITGKTSSGFNVILTPSPIGNTLAAGTFDVLVVA